MDLDICVWFTTGFQRDDIYFYVVAYENNCLEACCAQFMTVCAASLCDAFMHDTSPKL